MGIFPKIKLTSGLLKLAYHFVDVEASGDAALPDAHSVEYPFVLTRLNAGPKGKVLDVGCTAQTNYLPAILAAQGWDIYGIDLREFKFKHPDFHFVKGDITHTDFPDNYFDYVYEVSALEHIGRSGRYGVKSEDVDGDIKAVNEITRILKPGGKLLVMEAFGSVDKLIKPIGRVYDQNRLNRMFSNYKILDEIFYSNDNNGYWESISAKQAAEIGDKKYNGALVFLELVLKEKP